MSQPALGQGTTSGPPGGIHASQPDDWTDRLKIEPLPVANGGFSILFKAHSKDLSDTQVYAVKVINIETNNNDEKQIFFKRVRREIKVWHSLPAHRNILPLIGTVNQFQQYSTTAMVGYWMEAGALHYRLHPELPLSQRKSWICDVIHGLQHLKENNVVHGDLTGLNVLITDKNVAILCDFGLSKIVNEFANTSYWTRTVGNCRWLDPLLRTIEPVTDIAQAEALEDQGRGMKMSYESDVYSLGSLCLQIMSGKMPYHDTKEGFVVMLRVSAHIKPTRPPGCEMDRRLWAIIQSCWSPVISSRPSLEQIESCVGKIQA